MNVWGFFERFWCERSDRRWVWAFGGPSHTYKLILAREERNNL